MVVKVTFGKGVGESLVFPVILEVRRGMEQLGECPGCGGGLGVKSGEDGAGVVCLNLCGFQGDRADTVADAIKQWCTVLLDPSCGKKTVPIKERIGQWK